MAGNRAVADGGHLGGGSTVARAVAEAVVGEAPFLGAAGTPAGDRVNRLDLARGLLRRMEDRAAGTSRPAPVPGEDGRVLPVAAPLVPLLPAGGLRRGTTVSVSGGPGTMSLLFALLAEASAEGAWAGVIGVPGLGAVAAAEAGVRLDRLALVPRPGADLVAVAAALLDGLDLVVVAGAARSGVRAADRQRLAARARQRGAVLLALGSWPGADLVLGCERPRWRGIGRGAGRLRSRCAVVRATGRGTGAVGREVELLLPGPVGAVEVDAGSAGAPVGVGAAGVGGAVLVEAAVQGAVQVQAEAEAAVS